jgi:hypothetical protein
VDEAGISVNLVTEGEGTAQGAADGLGGSEAAFPADKGADSRPSARGGLGRLDPGVDLSSGRNDEEHSRLREELEEAIALEDYERAAYIRDRLRDLGP